MPQVGERKTVGGVTGEFDGTTWRQVTDAPSSDTQEPGLMRFLGGAAKTSPLNPMNLAHAAMHPLDTLWNTVATPVDEARQAIKSGAETVTGSGGSRLASGADSLLHMLGAVPFVGKPLVDAGEKIFNGDWAGGAGEAAGLASGALLPKVPGAVADSMEGIGRGAEALGKSKPLARAQALAPLEAMTGHPLAAAASIAAPPLLRGGGRLMQKGGGALNGLIDAVKGPATVEAEAAPYVSKSTEVPYNWGWHKMAGDAPKVEPNAFTGGQEAPGPSQFFNVAGEDGFTPHEMPKAPQDLSGALAELSNSVRRSNLKPIDKFYEDNPQAVNGGEGRMTGQFEEGSGGLSDVAAGRTSRYPTAGEKATMDGLDSRISGLSPLDELATLSGRKLSLARSQELLDKFKGGR